MVILQTTLLALSLVWTGVNAIDITWTDEASIKEGAATAAWGLVKYYTGNNTGDVAGNLPDPYYWWEAGAMFGALIDYWWLTGDASYNNITSMAILHQVGNDADFMPDNQTLTEGNDDQGFWGMTSMSAAEHKFTNPSSDEPQWLALTQAVFNEYVSRWDTADCSGGLRWQIFTFNNGYDYKNSIANGCFFNIAARLARYTGNDTYSDWAVKIWNWMEKVDLLSDYQIYDGITIGTNNCSTPDTAQWTYNAGIFLHGAAVMYNITQTNTWKTRLDGLLSDVTSRFVKDDVIYEQFCEQDDQCNTDEQSFKGYLSRWLASTTQMAPYTNETISPILLGTAKAAAAVCTGTDTADFKGHQGTACGFSWLNTTYDGDVGVGSQMNAMSIIMSTLISQATTPYTSTTGGTSKGNAAAGNKDSSSATKYEKAITRADRVGAAILTLLMSVGVISGTYFILT